MITVKPCLSDILKQEGMTQSELSKLTGVPQSAISRFDTNRQHSDIHMFLIARALNRKVDDLFKIIEE